MFRRNMLSRVTLVAHFFLDLVLLFETCILWQLEDRLMSSFLRGGKNCSDRSDLPQIISN